MHTSGIRMDTNASPSSARAHSTSCRGVTSGTPARVPRANKGEGSPLFNLVQIVVDYLAAAGFQGPAGKLHVIHLHTYQATCEHTGKRSCYFSPKGSPGAGGLIEKVRAQERCDVESRGMGMPFEKR